MDGFVAGLSVTPKKKFVGTLELDVEIVDKCLLAESGRQRLSA